MGEEPTAPPSPLFSYQVGKAPLFVVGTFDVGVTVLSQQVRALNLVHALVESGFLPSPSDKAAKGGNASKTSIAIVGGGFSGLTAAAALIKKNVDAKITIFEERDTLLPLQQGSDTRWLHPRIYDWPGAGSESAAAMLPIMNWTAGRASDVVVQILTEWKRTARQREDGLSLYCNARHLQVHGSPEKTDRLKIEWVGERRDPCDGTTDTDPQMAGVGLTELFDAVILSIGFGIERDSQFSYWRNETLGQPSLDQPRLNYLVSGQGDGAMIDLLRLRISQFRQDRILEELFRGKDSLLSAIRALHKKYSTSQKAGLFDELEDLANSGSHSDEFQEAMDQLRRRLRRDTEVVLRLKVRKFSELFDPKTTRISFQNRILVFLLYRCGGFFPTSQNEEEAKAKNAIPDGCVVRRHGTLRVENLKRLLSPELQKAIKKRRKSSAAEPFSQSSDAKWPGGYFGFPGPAKDAPSLGDSLKEHWRKEYLPGPTALLGAALCGSLVGAVRHQHPGSERLRVTLHRAVVLGKDELLQQTCDYPGVPRGAGASAAGRTFPARNATIGVAYRCRRIVRSKRGASPKDLAEAMGKLDLNAASRTMSEGVSFLLAIPIIEPNMNYTSPNPVAGVIYLDSMAEGFFVKDDELRSLVSMVQTFLDELEGSPRAAFERITNWPLSGTAHRATVAEALPSDATHALELVSTVEPPKTMKPFQLNYDYSDIGPLE